MRSKCFCVQELATAKIRAQPSPGLDVLKPSILPRSDLESLTDAHEAVQRSCEMSRLQVRVL